MEQRSERKNSSNFDTFSQVKLYKTRRSSKSKKRHSLFKIQADFGSSNEEYEFWKKFSKEKVYCLKTLEDLDKNESNK